MNALHKVKRSTQILHTYYNIGGLMTQAQILQNVLLADMFRRLTDYTDSELMNVKQCAVELRDGRYIKAIKEEMNRREREI
jgi:hypothetical protein